MVSQHDPSDLSPERGRPVEAPEAGAVDLAAAGSHLSLGGTMVTQGYPEEPREPRLALAPVRQLASTIETTRRPSLAWWSGWGTVLTEARSPEEEGDAATAVCE